jgi:uncharacterized glyoxalase superfamily protein PhnB
VQLSPYLLSNRQCEAACKLYQKALGCEIEQLRRRPNVQFLGGRPQSGVRASNLHQLRNEGTPQRHAMRARDEEESS